MEDESRTLGELYAQATALSPRAARFAEKLLANSLQVPYEVRIAMRLALLARSREAARSTASEWASLDRPHASKNARMHADATDAHVFLDACMRAFAAPAD